MRLQSLTSSIVLLCLTLLTLPNASAQVNVVMQHNDLERTGQNLHETTLTPSNVNVNSFGLLFRIATDNQVYAQPLVVSNLTIAGGTHNVVFVATTNNSVYAFDADKGNQYWHVNLGTPINNGNYGSGCVDINGNAGIVGTPVIDTVSQTIYVVNSLNNGGAFSFMLHALDITTGADKSGSPVQITNTPFNALTQNQRAGLALSGGNVLIPFSSHCDMGSYHGLLFSYNASTLAKNAVFNTSPTGGGDSLWGSGQGPAVDASGNIYFGTSNGTWDGVSNFSESFIKLSPSLGLLDWFTAGNHASLDGGDADLDTSGPLLIPPGDRLVMVGKSANGYVINTANMGHLGDASAVQALSLGGALHGSAVYWDGATNGPEVYMWAQGDHLKAFQFNGNTLVTPNFQNGPDFVGGEPGAFLSISANGNTNGIVWANAVLSGNANHASTPGVLRAYDANNIATDLYNNQQNATRDTCSNFAKNGYPTVANGKVYLGSFGTANAGSGQLCVYGLLSTTTTCAAPTTPGSLTATATSASQINLSWTASTSSCAVSYNVFRSTTSGFTPSSSNQIASGVTSTSFSNTGLAASTTYFYLVEATNTGGTSGASNQASATTQAGGGGGGGGTGSVQINAGGPAVSPFAADTGFAGGSTINHANTIDLSGVTNPAPAAVYQTARIGNFTYTIPGFAAGSSNTVRLHFAETFWTAAGSRIFNVSINGTQVLANFDVFAAAGAQNKAVVRQFTANANSSGQYVITFTSVKDNSLVSAIEVGSGSTTTTAALQINSGGPAVSPFAADKDFTGGATINHANTINVSGVTNPAPAAVYQTARIGTFTYTLPGFAAGSSHTLRLHFAETYWTVAGSRIFNVSINGTQVLANFDVFAAAGAQNQAVVRQFTATANSSGQFVITFTTVKDNSLVSAIEVQ